MSNVPHEVDLHHRRVVVGSEPMIFHCHHYNTFLQRSIQDAEYIDSTPFLVGAAAEAAYGQLSYMFQAAAYQTEQSRKTLAEELYRWAGFGTWDLSGLTAEGGTIKTAHAHYSRAWKAKWGKSEGRVGYFASGWLAGATAAIFGKPAGSYAVTQTACKAFDGTDYDAFEVTPGEANYEIFKSVGVGALTEVPMAKIPSTPVDHAGIQQAVSGLPLIGDGEGNIDAFGVYLTRHYANYYNRISFEFLRRMTSQFGEMGRSVADPLLTEAGHVCAFNTFGGIMTSPEWKALIQPTLKTDEDWVQGMIAVANALGWGRWQCTDVSRDYARFELHNDYETVGYKAMYGELDDCNAFLAKGGVIGLMNLVYTGRIMDQPDLTPEFYGKLFREKDWYSATVEACPSKGDNVLAFGVKRNA